MAPEYVGERLARFVTDTSWAGLPDAVRHEGKRSFLNFLGCTLGTAHESAVEMALRTLSPLSGQDRTTVIGRGRLLDILGASFVNAIAANLLDYDDTHLRTVIHPSAPVAPVALGLAEQRGLSGRDLLGAFILGAEIECRVGNAVSPGHYARGWHITSTCGIFGAAAAGARLLGLDAVQTMHALGLAASQSAGLVENLPTQAKNLSVGNAARNGLFASLLAERGYTSAVTAIEGPLGWARAMGDEPAITEVVGGLGEQWELLQNTYKSYPCGIVFHSVIDACVELRNQYALTDADIAAITVSGNQLLLDRGNRLVNSAGDARVSTQHCAAVALHFGRADLDAFSDAAVNDPAIVCLRKRTSTRLDDALPSGAAAVTVRTKDGRTLETQILQAIGSIAQPLPDKAIEDKVRDLSGHGGSSGDIEAVIGAAWNIDRLDTVEPLLALLQGR